jgi:hypothetical protein
MICLDPVGQNDNWSKAAHADPLQCALLMRSRVADRFNYDQVAVRYGFTQRLIGGVQIDSYRLVRNLVDNLPDLVTVGTALIEQRNPG